MTTVPLSHQCAITARLKCWWWIVNIFFGKWNWRWENPSYILKSLLPADESMVQRRDWVLSDRQGNWTWISSTFLSVLSTELQSEGKHTFFHCGASCCGGVLAYYAFSELTYWVELCRETCRGMLPFWTSTGH